MRPPPARKSKALGPDFRGEGEERPGVGAKNLGRHRNWGLIAALPGMSGLSAAGPGVWDSSLFGVPLTSRMVGELAGLVPRIWGSAALGAVGTSRMAG
ncbi:MAG: hypothetical protein ACRDV8_07840 [Acidimicrobiales bacterium]